MFQVGQVVVCVDDQFMEGIAELYSKLPVKDQLYTVRETDIGQKISDGQPAQVLRLHEIYGVRTGPSQREAGFDSARFAPLLDESTEAMLAEICEEPRVVPVKVPVQ